MTDTLEQVQSTKWDYRSFWDESLLQLKKELGEEEFGIWFSKIEYLRAEETVIYISVPSNFFLGMFSPKYLPRLENKIEELTGKTLTLSIEVQKKEEKPKENAGSLSTGTGETTGKPEKNQIPDGKQQIPSKPSPEAEKRKNHPLLQEMYTFDTYVVGEINNYAFNAALVVSKNPGTKIYNPLLIYGGTGLGKTHLMQAIGHYIHQNSDQKVLYITGEGFMREFIDAMQSSPKDKDAFAKKYRNVDVLLIDDVHTIEKGPQTQDELFYTFETLVNKKKQMVFTCDRPITELKNLVPRLKSRFQSGVNIELYLPSYEELIAILKKKMELKKIELKKDIKITDEIIELIIKNISTNIRDMEGALNNLMSYADLVNKPVTLEIAQRQLKDVFADPKQGNMSIDIIQRVVADNYNLTPNDLKGKKRSSGIVKPRHIAIYLSRELTEFSLTEIGQSFGGRDHTTVLYSSKIIEETSRSDINLYTTLEKLKRMIKEYNVK